MAGVQLRRERRKKKREKAGRAGKDIRKIREKMENQGPNCWGKISQSKGSLVPDTQSPTGVGWPALPQEAH